MTNIQFQRGAIDAGGCVSGGWNLIKSNYWSYFGITTLLALVSIVLSCIPFVPILFQIFVAPPITVGIYFMLFREMNGEPVDFGMAFRGFDKFVPAMIIGLINAIPQIIILILNFALNLGSALTKILPQIGRGSRSDFVESSDAAPVIAGGIILVIVIIGIGFLLFSIAWGITFFFAMPLIAENDITALDAIKLSAAAGWRNIGGIILLVIIEVLMLLAGVLALCFGVLFVLPVVFAANAVAYRMVFPRIRDNFNYAPPPPNMYGSSFGSGLSQ